MIKRFGARAPSNIALIKYMGKKGFGNIPENPSLSMTLTNLCSFAEVEVHEDGSSSWRPELPGFSSQIKGALSPVVPDLSSEGVEKVLKHIERVRVQGTEIFRAHQLALRPEGYNLVLRTANTFPEASGIASSASSFAAVTLAVASAMAEDFSAFYARFSSDASLKRRLAALSRQGSGSSCRSFEGPFVEWSGEDTATSPSSLPALAHFVLVVSGAKKAISTSRAHALIKSSPLWQGRVKRVEDRLEKIRAAMKAGDFSSVARISWEESWEMHSLFHTVPFASETEQGPFTYWQPGTIEALEFFRPFVLGSNPPIVTLDAGPNPHVIVPASDADEWRLRLKERFPRNKILEDIPGQGATAWSLGAEGV